MNSIIIIIIIILFMLMSRLFFFDLIITLIHKILVKQWLLNFPMFFAKYRLRIHRCRLKLESKNQSAINFILLVLVFKYAIPILYNNNQENCIIQYLKFPINLGMNWSLLMFKYNSSAWLMAVYPWMSISFPLAFSSLSS